MRLSLGILSTLLFSFYSYSAIAETTLACRQLDELGLYEQCEEVKIMKTLGERSRVYSLAEKKLVTLDTKNLFKVQILGATETIEKNDLLTIPGSLIWTSSTKFHQTLCKSDEAKASDKLLKLDCGKSQQRQVHRKLVYKLVQVPASATFNSNFQSKK